MRKWTTEILAVDPYTGDLTTWMGPYIDAPSIEEAELYCQENGLGYCRVTGRLVAEVDEKTGFRLDFDNLN